MYSIIIVTGTPCTGKTTIAKRIASILKFKYIDANRLIKISKIHDKYDKKSDYYNTVHNLYLVMVSFKIC